MLNSSKNFHCANSISGTSCLRDLVLTVPPAVSLGETVTLNCSYHLQGENLYAIKLYKGRNEFMTYAAERQPPLRSFPLKGIHIGVRKSKFYPIHPSYISPPTHQKVFRVGNIWVFSPLVLSKRGKNVLVLLS